MFVDPRNGNYNLISLLLNRISVKNEFLDEKEDACTSLGELAGNTGYIKI